MLKISKSIHINFIINNDCINTQQQVKELVQYRNINFVFKGLLTLISMS